MVSNSRMVLANEEWLPMCLSAAVPLWIYRVRNWTSADRHARAMEIGDYIAAHGDIVRHQAMKGESSAEAFNRTAEGIAIGAYQPGGLTIFGLHWCAGSSHYGTHDDSPCKAEKERGCYEP